MPRVRHVAWFTLALTFPAAAEARPCPGPDRAIGDPASTPSPSPSSSHSVCSIEAHRFDAATGAPEEIAPLESVERARDPEGAEGASAPSRVTAGPLVAMRIEPGGLPSRRGREDGPPETTWRPQGPGVRDTPASPPEGAAEEREPIGLQLDVGIASMYASRGANVFQDRSRHDAHVVIAPSVSYAHESGFEIAYAGAYQANGDNRAANVDAGVGAEQGVVVGISREVTSDLTLSGRLGGIFYPLADPEVAGTEVPTSLEPQVEATWATVVDLTLFTSYTRGIQEVVAPASHVYVRPSVGRSFDVTPSAQVGVAAGAGLKLPSDPAAMPDNRFDVQVDLEVVGHPTESTYVTPALHYGWTDLDAVSAADAHLVWASVNTGVEL